MPICEVRIEMWITFFQKQGYTVSSRVKIKTISRSCEIKFCMSLQKIFIRVFWILYGGVRIAILLQYSSVPQVASFESGKLYSSLSIILVKSSRPTMIINVDETYTAIWNVVRYLLCSSDVEFQKMIFLCPESGVAVGVVPLA